jgi:hypothetical protein
VTSADAVSSSPLPVPLFGVESGSGWGATVTCARLSYSPAAPLWTLTVASNVRLVLAPEASVVTFQLSAGGTALRALPPAIEPAT